MLNIALQPVTQSTGITSVRKAGPVDLYDLMVEDQPEFFAGGILVHNCRIHHVGSFPILEDQMASFDPLSSKGSPDRMDALVWLMTELMLGPGGDVTRARF